MSFFFGFFGGRGFLVVFEESGEGLVGIRYRGIVVRVGLGGGRVYSIVVRMG